MAKYTDWAPHVTVAVVVEQDGRFLVVEEEAEGGRIVFNQPAGHVEKGETLAEGACREALEETGWDVRLTGFLGLYAYTPPYGTLTYYRACFLAEGLHHHPERALDKGIIRAVWMTRDELASCGRLRSPLVLKCVEDAAAGQRYPLSMVFEHHEG